jgi:hypothetical protein
MQDVKKIRQGGVGMEIEKYNSKEQFNKIKKISGELRDHVEKEFPELQENDIDFLNKLLGIELKHSFVKL